MASPETSFHFPSKAKYHMFVQFLKQKVGEHPGLPLQHLTGYMSQFPRPQMEGLKFSMAFIKKALLEHPQFFFVDADDCVRLVEAGHLCNLDVAWDLQQSQEMPDTLPRCPGLKPKIHAVKGMIYKLLPVFGFIGITEPVKASVFFVSQSFEDGKKSMQELNLSVGTEVYVNAVLAPPKHRAEYTATRVWHITNQQYLAQTFMERPPSARDIQNRYQIDGVGDMAGSRPSSDVRDFDNEAWQSSSTNDRFEGCGQIHSLYGKLGFIKCKEMPVVERIVFPYTSIQHADINSSGIGWKDVLKVNDDVLFHAVKSHEANASYKWQAKSVIVLRLDESFGNQNHEAESVLQRDEIYSGIPVGLRYGGAEKEPWNDIGASRKVVQGESSDGSPGEINVRPSHIGGPVGGNIAKTNLDSSDSTCERWLRNENETVRAMQGKKPGTKLRQKAGQTRRTCVSSHYTSTSEEDTSSQGRAGPKENLPPFRRAPTAASQDMTSNSYNEKKAKRLKQKLEKETFWQKLGVKFQSQSSVDTTDTSSCTSESQWDDEEPLSKDGDTQGIGTSPSDHLSEMDFSNRERLKASLKIAHNGSSSNISQEKIGPSVPPKRDIDWFSPESSPKMYQNLPSAQAPQSVEVKTMHSNPRSCSGGNCTFALSSSDKFPKTTLHSPVDLSTSMNSTSHNDIKAVAPQDFIIQNVGMVSNKNMEHKHINIQEPHATSQPPPGFGSIRLKAGKGSLPSTDSEEFQDAVGCDSGVCTLHGHNSDALDSLACEKLIPMAHPSSVASQGKIVQTSPIEKVEAMPVGLEANAVRDPFCMSGVSPAIFPAPCHQGLLESKNLNLGVNDPKVEKHEDVEGIIESVNRYFGTVVAKDVTAPFKFFLGNLYKSNKPAGELGATLDEIIRVGDPVKFNYYQITDKERSWTKVPLIWVGGKPKTLKEQSVSDYLLRLKSRPGFLPADWHLEEDGKKNPDCCSYGTIDDNGVRDSEASMAEFQTKESSLIPVVSLESTLHSSSETDVHNENDDVIENKPRAHFDNKMEVFEPAIFLNTEDSSSSLSDRLRLPKDSSPCPGYSPESVLELDSEANLTNVMLDNSTSDILSAEETSSDMPPKCHHTDKTELGDPAVMTDRPKSSQTVINGDSFSHSASPSSTETTVKSVPSAGRHLLPENRTARVGVPPAPATLDDTMKTLASQIARSMWDTLQASLREEHRRHTTPKEVKASETKTVGTQTTVSGAILYRKLYVE